MILSYQQHERNFRAMIRINNNWEFTPSWSEDFMQGNAPGTAVRLPHTVRESPLHYASPADYEMVSGYRKVLDLPRDLAGKRVFLQFDGAAHIAEVYINEVKVAEHRSGYTAFRAEITDHLKDTGNVVAVRLDSTENSAIPPFGFVIDYLTFGGLYRDVWLDIRNSVYLDPPFITTPEPGEARVECAVQGDPSGLTKRISILSEAGDSIASAIVPAATLTASVPAPDARCWDLEDPVCYRCRVELLDGSGKVLDTVSETFGFRTVEFKDGAFYLNSKKVFIRGLNRHQCYPYAGYAVPEQLQREDARILKEELQVNAVRTSHYPQSHYFLDECDHRGLLVFTEIPGWQHIGDDAWKKQACENVREMVLQYRNHPSIFLWGVRINESLDDDDFYRETNRIAHELDPSRCTSGVRYIENSHLLEDVYSYNDFSHNGKTPGAMAKKAVTKEDAPLLISEANGHMFPTKAWDPWEKRQEHALRHARVLNAAMADGDHVGCYQWCMFDYPTHQDFGSGDRICYHGVMDYFRNAKPAAATHASQGQRHPVLEVISSMDIGDYAAGIIGNVTCLTNADEVRMYKNDKYVATFHSDPAFSALPHGPVTIDDTVGALLETEEGFSGEKARVIRKCMNIIRLKGLAGLSTTDKALFGYAMVRFRLKYEDLVRLYGLYIGNWGGQATAWRFDAVTDGEVVASVTKAPSRTLHLDVTASHTELKEGEVYDMAAVRIRLLDEYGNVAVYDPIPVTIMAEGPVEIVGPSVTVLEGGMGGTYLRTTGSSGTARVTLFTDQTEPVSLMFTVKQQ